MKFIKHKFFSLRSYFVKKEYIPRTTTRQVPVTFITARRAPIQVAPRVLPTREVPSTQNGTISSQNSDPYYAKVQDEIDYAEGEEPSSLKAVTFNTEIIASTNSDEHRVMGMYEATRCPLCHKCTEYHNMGVCKFDPGAGNQRPKEWGDRWVDVKGKVRR